MIGAHSGHGKITGTIVVDESEPVVVNHSLPVIDDPYISVERPGG